MDYILSLLPAMLEGTGVTLKLFFLTLAMSLPIGVVMALARITKFKPLNIFMQLYI